MGITTARAAVGAEAVRDALDLLTEIAAPLRVRMALGRGRLVLTTHGDEPWWATVTVPLADVEVDAEAAATVARLDLSQGVDAEALLVPEATCLITIVADDVVRYGAFALPASDRPDPAPPRIDGSGAPIGTWEVAGGRYEHPDGRVLAVPASSLGRFVAREIETVELVEDGAVPYLVGRERGRGAAELVLVVGGEWV